MEKTKITAKDLMTVGLFTAIIFVISMTVSMLGFIPVLMPVLTVTVLLTGVPFMLFLTKTKKLGMITMMGTLCGFILGLMGMGVYWMTATGFIASFSADLISRSGNYANVKKSVLSHAVFCQ